MLKYVYLIAMELLNLETECILESAHVIQSPVLCLCTLCVCVCVYVCI